MSFRDRAHDISLQLVPEGSRREEAVTVFMCVVVGVAWGYVIVGLTIVSLVVWPT